VLAKLLYALPAWLGFTTVSDKRRSEAFIRHAFRLQLYSATSTQLAEDANESLFSRIKQFKNHVLCQFIFDPNCYQYNLHPQ